MATHSTIPVDIMGVLDFYEIPYKTTGNIVMVNCIFHAGDNTPSMAVYPQTNSFYCFACSQSGTPETIVMKMEGCSYSEAVKKLYGTGYEWRKLRSDVKKSTRVDETYLYEIIGKNLRKEMRNNVGNAERLSELKRLVLKYSAEQLDPGQLYAALCEIKGRKVN